ncbi:MAG: hypothetical protein IJJ45_06980 [Clostridia bacterium]|nr:hypothetical protein [Clostridia bacterium]
MSFRQTGLCRLVILVLAVCMLTGGVFAALGEPEMTEEQIDEASNKAYEEAMLQGETQIAFTTVATLGQYLSDLMVYAYGEIPASETDSVNAAVQLVDEVIRRADQCFRSEETGAAEEKLAGFDQAKEAWKAAAEQFGAEGDKFETGLFLTDDRVIDPATDAFGSIPAEAQPVYLEKAENVYRAIWQALRPAVAAKVGDALEIPGIANLVDNDEISELEDAVVDIIADVKDMMSNLSEGFNVGRSEERARIEQVASRLNSLESEVKIVINALGIDTVTRLVEDGEN